MPVALSYPGVYIQELPSGVHPIVGVPTSVAAFVGGAARGPTNQAIRITSFGDYERTFGALDPAYPMSQAVQLFFTNGGATAEVVRAGVKAAADGKPTADGAVAAFPLSKDTTLVAASPGEWGNSLSVSVDFTGLKNPKAFLNLTVQEMAPDGLSALATERYSAAPLAGLGATLRSSQLVSLAPDSTPATVPAAGTYSASGFQAPDSGDEADKDEAKDGAKPAAAKDDGKTVKGTNIPDASLDLPGDPETASGIYALTKVDIFNMLCLPVAAGSAVYTTQVLGTVLSFCEDHRAMLIVDPPKSWSGAAPLTFEVVNAGAVPAHHNAAVYYPNLTINDEAGQPRQVGPCGAVAGVWAATDSGRGVWKAPAGLYPPVLGIDDLEVHVNDPKNGELNPLGVNVIRTMPLAGPVVWGARTTRGADELADQWKYLPVRRTALYIEESLRRATQWVVFEPNDEPLWSQIRLNVGVFMFGLFRKGAFEGSTPADAFFVQCDGKNNPQDQIDLGIVNILVGFAPLKPAEFVVISIQQLAGQLGM